jgi:hypothetical protein
MNAIVVPSAVIVWPPRKTNDRLVGSLGSSVESFGSAAVVESTVT